MPRAGRLIVALLAADLLVGAVGIAAVAWSAWERQRLAAACSAVNEVLAYPPPPGTALPSTAAPPGPAAATRRR